MSFHTREKISPIKAKPIIGALSNAFSKSLRHKLDLLSLVGGAVIVKKCHTKAGTPLKSCHWPQNEENQQKYLNLNEFSIPYLDIFQYI